MSKEATPLSSILEKNFQLQTIAKPPKPSMQTPNKPKSHLAFLKSQPQRFAFLMVTFITGFPICLGREADTLWDIVKLTLPNTVH